MNNNNNTFRTTLWLVWVQLFHCSFLSWKVVVGSNMDQFNYRETTIGNDYAPKDWDQVGCTDLDQCLGWPDGWELGKGWSLESNQCEWCPLDAAITDDPNCQFHQQSPIDLQRFVADPNSPFYRPCEDKHWMAYEEGGCDWNDMINNPWATTGRNAFQIRRHALQIVQPVDEETGILQCQGIGRKFPRLDFPNGFPLFWHLAHTEITTPSEHTQHGHSYDAAVHLAHFYQFNDGPEGNIDMGKVIVFLQADESVPTRWPYLDKLLCQFREVEDAVRDECSAAGLLLVDADGDALIPTVPDYPGCRNGAPPAPSPPPKAPFTDPYPWIDCDLVPEWKQICRRTGGCCQSEANFGDAFCDGIYEQYADSMGSVCYWCCPGKLVDPAVLSLSSVSPSAAAPVPAPPPSPTNVEELPFITFVSNNFCTPDDPCDACVGDCDTDEDCKGEELKCHQKRTDVGDHRVPGCQGLDNSGRDFCYDPTSLTADMVNATLHFISDHHCRYSICGACQGDCDFDSECAGNLECFRKAPGEEVTIPGCEGLDLSGADFCYDPTWTDATPPSISPFSSPSNLPSASPTFGNPSGEPTVGPSEIPSSADTAQPSVSPSQDEQSSNPSDIPSLYPSLTPSSFPSTIPSDNMRSSSPSTAPSESEDPTSLPSKAWSSAPSSNPSTNPSNTPTTSSNVPSSGPSRLRSSNPSSLPSTSSGPSTIPTTIRSAVPSGSPTFNPSSIPSVTPTSSNVPSSNRSKSPTSEPSSMPSTTTTPSTTTPSVMPSVVQVSSESPSSSPLPMLTFVSDHHCTSSNPCHECVGDCDGDHDCKGDLKCLHKRANVGDYRVPGCDGFDNSGRDFCYNPYSLTAEHANGTLHFVSDNHCKHHHLCGACQGDCDHDDECVGDLKCFRKQAGVGDGKVPGCTGTDLTGADFCYDPIATGGGRKLSGIKSWKTTPDEEDSAILHEDTGGANRDNRQSKYRLSEQDFRPPISEEDFRRELQEYEKRRDIEQSTVQEQEQQRRQLQSEFNYEDIPYSHYEWLREVNTEFFFRYEGSQMVPPCYANAHYRIMKDPIRVHPDQIAELERLLAHRVAPVGEPNECQVDTAGKERTTSTKEAVDLNRPLQSTTDNHQLTFCHCDTWVSKVQADLNWCASNTLEDRLYNKPYNFESDGF